MKAGSFTATDSDKVCASEEVLIEATEAWMKDPLFKDYYPETGVIISGYRPETIQHILENGRPTPE